MEQDLPWLHYCLRFISKYATDIKEVVVVFDHSCIDKIHQFAGILPAGMVTWHAVPDWKNGYIQQQYYKLYADQFVKADNILYVDSDCCFHMPFSGDDFMIDGTPILMKRRYEVAEEAKIWQPITEAAMGWKIEFEYMEFLPLMFRRSTLPALRAVTGQLVESLRQLKTRDFSEFNCLGAFVERFESTQYAIRDAAAYKFQRVAVQKWSWGSITPEIKLELEGYLA